MQRGCFPRGHHARDPRRVLRSGRERGPGTGPGQGPAAAFKARLPRLLGRALMSFELHSERQAYVEVLEHEVKKVVRMIRAFPPAAFEQRDPDCARSPRELAAEFETHVRRIEELATGR